MWNVHCAMYKGWYEIYLTPTLCTGSHDREAQQCQRKFVKNYLGNFIYLILTGEMEQNECGGQSWAQQIILILEYSWKSTLMHILQFLFISSVRPAGFLWELVTFNFTYSLFTQVGSGVAWERNFWQYPFVKELGSYSSLSYFVSSFILHKLNKIVFYPRFWWSLFCAVCVSSSQ